MRILVHGRESEGGVPCEDPGNEDLSDGCLHFSNRLAAEVAAPPMTAVLTT